MEHILLGNGVTRRDFLKGCSYVAAAAILGGCHKKTKGYIPDDTGDEDIGDDTYSFNIHPSADVLDSVQTFVKFQTNKLDAVVESSQPMFMLSAPSVSHDGSFKPLSKTYGQPEILHLDNNSDGNTYVEINTNSHKNNIGLVKERIKISTTPKIQRSNGLSYTYNDIVSCNGSQHNTVNENGKFISQKMAIVSANSKMALGDEWNDIEQWHDIMTNNDDTTLANQLTLIYQYDEVDPIDHVSNSDIASSWINVDMMASLKDVWLEERKALGQWSLSPLDLGLISDKEFFVSIEDVSKYTDGTGREFLYGTVSVSYFYSIGFIVTFDGSEPKIHWYIPEELWFNKKGSDFITVFQYSTRYAFLAAPPELIYPFVDGLGISLDNYISFSDKQTVENNLGKHIYEPMALVDDNVVMTYTTYVIINGEKSDKAAFIQVPLNAENNGISLIDTQDPDNKKTVDELVSFDPLNYNPNLKNYYKEDPRDVQNMYHLNMTDSVNDRFFLEIGQDDNSAYGLYLNHAAYNPDNFSFQLDLDVFSSLAFLDDSTSIQWYVEEGLIPQTEHSVSDYLGDDCSIEYSVNHQGKTITVYFIPKDPNKFSFEWKIDKKSYDGSERIDPPQPVAYGVKRLLPWNNYLHESELLYVGLEQKNIAPLSNGANAGSLRDLTHQSSSEVESYFYAYSDYLEKNWKLVELQNAPKEAPKAVESIHKVKQKIHQATLVITDHNNNAVTLSKNLHVEIRCNSAVSMQDVTNPDKIKKVQLNRTTSYLAKDDGQGHVKLQIDVGHESDLLTAVDLHYRIVDAGESGITAFTSTNPGSPEKILNTSERSLTTQWGSFNISYLLHGRNAVMDTPQPTAPSGTDLIQTKYGGNFDDKYSSSQKTDLLSSTKDAFIKVSKGTIPQNAHLPFLKDDLENHSPLYAVRTLNGNMLNHSLESFLDHISDAVNRAMQIAKSLEAAAEKAAEAVVEAAVAALKKLKEAVHNLINDLNNLMDDVTASVSGILNGIAAFCTSVLKGIVSYVKLLIDIFMGRFDFRMAFDVGAGLKKLITENFTQENSGIFGAIYKDIEGDKPAIIDVMSKNKGKISVPSNMNDIMKSMPQTEKETAAKSTAANHENATHNNHTKNQISQHVDFSGFSVVTSVESAYLGNGCGDTVDDIVKLFEDIAVASSNITSDASKGKFGQMSTDLETVMGKMGGDIASIAEDILKCIIDHVLGAFTQAMKDILEMPLPGFIKTILNDVIVPLFGLGNNKFEVAVDILFFILGYGINILSTIGTAIMKPITDMTTGIAPKLDLKDINVSDFLANGSASELAKRYGGLTGVSTYVDDKDEKTAAITALIMQSFSDFIFIPAYFAQQDASAAITTAGSFDHYMEKVETLLLAIEIIVKALKLIAIELDKKQKSTTVQVEDSELLRESVLFMYILAGLFHAVPMDKDLKPVANFIRFAILGVAHGLDVASYLTEGDAQNVEVNGLIAAIVDTIPNTIELGLALQGEAGPVELLIALGATLGAATTADMLEYVDIIKA